MGGYGSGRWDGVWTRRTVRECLRVELSKPIRDALKRIDIAINSGDRAGAQTVLRWQSRGEESGSVGLQMLGTPEDGITVLILYRSEGEAIADRVEVAYTDQRIAGRRAWLVCPGCKRRCSVLYHPMRRTHVARFRCRWCHNLAYQSQCDSDKHAYRLARRMGGAGGIDTNFGGMNCRGLITFMKASDIYKRRQARALRRDMGKRWAKRNAFYLDMLETI